MSELLDDEDEVDELDEPPSREARALPAELAPPVLDPELVVLLPAVTTWPTLMLTAATVPAMGLTRAAWLRLSWADVSPDWADVTEAWSASSWDGVMLVDRAVSEFSALVSDWPAVVSWFWADWRLWVFLVS